MEDSSLPADTGHVIPLRSDPQFLGYLYEELRVVDQAASVLKTSLNKLSTEKVNITRNTDGLKPKDQEETRKCEKHIHKRFDEDSDNHKEVVRVLAGIRKEINLFSRPHIRDLNLLSLPDEILRNIFQEVRGWMPFLRLDRISPRFEKIGDIQSLRLTCWRICNAASHLLLHVVEVNMSEESLAHLEEVCRHPTISKGIQCIRVHLYFYNSALANDQRAFADFHGRRLRQYRVTMEDLIINRTFYTELQVSEARETILNATKILHAWDVLIENFFDMDSYIRNCTDDDLQAALGIFYSAFRKFCALYSDQDAVRINFASRVAAAIVKCPTFYKLELLDDEDYQFPSFKQELHTIWVGDIHNDAHIKRMCFPIGFAAGHADHATNLPVHMLTEIPIAIFKAGGSILDLDVYVSIPSQVGMLVPGAEDAACLKEALQHVKALRIEPRVPRIPASELRSNEDMQSLGSFVASFTDTPRLSRLDIDFQDYLSNIFDDGTFVSLEEPKYSISSLIGRSLEYPLLQELCIRYVPIHLWEIKRLAQQFYESGTLKVAQDETFVRFMLLTNYLLSGTWEEVIEVLKELSTRYRTGDRPGIEIIIHDPFGAERDGLTQLAWHRLFGKKSALAKSHVEEYINQEPTFGLENVNPFRQLS